MLKTLNAFSSFAQNVDADYGDDGYDDENDYDYDDDDDDDDNDDVDDEDEGDWRRGLQYADGRVGAAEGSFGFGTSRFPINVFIIIITAWGEEWLNCSQIYIFIKKWTQWTIINLVHFYSQPLKRVT